MKIKLKEVTIRNLVKDYKETPDNGVVGYNNTLNIRPPYQREFVYKEKQRNAVIETVMKDFPLNTLYWVDNEDGTYEVLDGQQRTISICEYVKGNFSVDDRAFHNLDEEEQEQLLNYKLMVYFCKGTNKDKLNWFKVINIAGEKLTSQELRNIAYIGPWLTSAKEHFSKNNCVAYNLGKDYVKGSPIRQDFLQTALQWATNSTVEHYMGKHQKDADAMLLWINFQKIISWVKITFPTYRSQMKGLPWGELYARHKDDPLNSAILEKRIADLFTDDEVEKKSGIYDFVLSGKESGLNLRSFKPDQKAGAYERQKGICIKCTKHFPFKEMQGDHVIPWSKGGKTIPGNLQMLCKECNARKSNT